MNPLLSRLQPYPFERLRQLHAGVTPNPTFKPISLGIGEPRHATPELIKAALTRTKDNFYTIPVHHQIFPWAMRKGIETVYRADARPIPAWTTIK